MKSQLQRWSVFGWSALIGSGLIAFAAFLQAPPSFSQWQKVELAAYGILGPLGAAMLGVAESHHDVAIGWLGAPLMFAHPTLPNPITALLTILGFALWFFVGDHTMTMLLRG